MDGFTIIDGVVAGVILLSAILAYSRGLVREVLAIAGWGAAAIVAFVFAPQAKPLIAEIPVVSDFLADSCELSMLAAFTAVFALALIVASILAPVLASFVQRSALSGIDQALGFLFGAARGALLVAVAMIVYGQVMVDQAVPMVDNSRSAAVFQDLTDRLNENLPQDAPGWITARYEDLMGSCETTATAAN